MGTKKQQKEVEEKMQPSDFKRWRKSLGLSQKEAAAALGLKRRVVQYYEKGQRDGEKVQVPKAIRLACYSLALGITDYSGPDKAPSPPNVSGLSDAAPVPEMAMTGAPEPSER